MNHSLPVSGQRFLPFLLLVCTLGIGLGSQAAVGDDSFRFEPNDVVAIYGNGLADRMQHDPWVETVLQSQLQGKNVSFRNMSFSGDLVNKKPRNKGFTNDDEYLQHVGPDVVLSFYGYNESFAGSGGADAYRGELVKLVARYTALREEAGKDVRFVLFSPIAYQNTSDPNLPEGTELNANLAVYTEATRIAAQETGAKFVDLFTPTLQLFQSSSEQYTINGIHLNAAGYRQLAKIISGALIGSHQSASSTSQSDVRLAKIYEAVEDKNWHWHNRYRATDGNDIWGSRSTLSFVDGQTNADVLKHELVMLDVMTANRDKAIWAAVDGKEYTIDDSNVPPPVKVISNVGGGSRSSNPDKEGSIDYLSPEESVAQIDVPEGYELNVFASEVQFPDLANPVQMQVDSKGRLWVASWNTYPKWEPGKEMNDTLMILEDTNKDGKADTRKIFANVHNPLGFEFWGGGVLVTSGPDLLFLKDTDGDDKADVRYPMLQGLGTSDTHHAANNLVMGPDGGIYWQSGIFLVHNHETPWKSNLNLGASGMYRFDPRTFAITPHAANSPNPHGTSFDRWGYCYANDGTGGRSYQVRPEGNGFKMHTLLTKEFRPVAANAILSSQHFPDELQDDFLICNTIGFLGVKQYSLDREGEMDDEPSGDPAKHVEISRGGGVITVNHPALKDTMITGFKLSVKGKQQMNICEVEVFSGDKNIADTATLTQSSQLASYAGKLLVDGDKTNFAHTMLEKNPWMKGEFAEPVSISGFQVWNRPEFEKRFDNGKIEFFNGSDIVASVDIKIGEETSKRAFGEVWGTPGLELLNSRDRNFRPTDAVIGEDGALYVSDWHNAIIGHMQHNIRDPNRDHAHGRILRLTVKDRPFQAPVKIDGESIESLLENLKHPTNGVRHRTRVELTARDSDAVIAATRQWIQGFDPNDELEAHHLLEALWVHQQHGVKNQELLEMLLGSKVKHAVVAAKTVRHFWENVDTKGGSEFAAKAESEFVKFTPPKHLDRAGKNAYKLGATVYQREAHCATCHLTHGKGSGNIYPPLVGSPWVVGNEERLIKLTLHGMWGKMVVNGKTYDPSRGVPPMTAFRSLLKDDELAAVLTFVRNTWGNQAEPVSAASVKKIREQTAQRGTFWKPDELLAEYPLEESLLADQPASVEEFSNQALEDELLAASPTELAKVAVQSGNAKRGKKVFYESNAACFACHDPPSGAARLGPDLATYKTKRTNEQLVDAILRPSDLIEKEFAQVSVLTVDGDLLTGVRVSENDDEVVLRNLAEPKPITILQDDIELIKESPVSMMPANLVRQLKNRQEFNDLMKYIIELRKQRVNNK